jgi:UPF0755 protein
MKLLKVPLLLLFFIFLLLLVSGGLFITVALFNSPTGAVQAEGILFQVKKGEVSEHVFIRLEQEQLVRSSLLLRLLSKISNTELSLKTGIYRINPGLTTWDIHAMLVSGKQEMNKITIREGWTLGQIAASLQQAGLMTADAFQDAARSPELRTKYRIPGRSVEGYLFPDTYYFPYDVSATTILSTMLDTFYAKLGELYPDYRKMEPQVLFQKVTLASIVEREYRKENEAPVIASVFYNRLRINQKLQSCATVEYVLTELLGKAHHERLTWADIAIKSPYNTYDIYGLPPGPIGNPGATALIASFFPMETKYKYFVLKDPVKGEHEFTETLQKHLSAKELYIKKY